MVRRFVLTLMVAMGMAWMAASPASAHAALAGADPAPGSVQLRQPSTVVLRFDEAVEPAASHAWISDRDGGHRRPLTLAPLSATTLQAGLSPLEPGVYRLGFDVEAADGHRTGGEYRFAVWPNGTPAPAGIDGLAITTVASIDRPLAATRGLALAGSLPLAGLAIAGYALRRRSALRAYPAILLSVGSAVVVADLVVLSWDRTPWEAAQTHFGGLLAAHAAAAALLVILARRSAHHLAAAMAGVVLIPLALTGHDYTLSAQPVLAAAMDWGHLASAAAWVGGLTWLLVRLAGRDRGGFAEDARHFSRWAPAAAVIVVVTGTFNAWSRVSAWHLLADSEYGRVLVVKVGLVVGALAFALAARKGRWRALSAEGVVMIGVLVAAATLAMLTPPIVVRERPAGPVLASAVLGEQVYAVLITPATPGPNTVRVTPTHATEGDPAPPTVQVVVAGSDATDVDLRPTSSGWIGTLQLPRQQAGLRLTTGAVAQEVFVPTARPASKLRLETEAALGGPDGGECRSRLIGQMVAIDDYNAARHAQAALVASDTEANCQPLRTASDTETVGRIVGRFLSQNKVTSAAVVGDETTRSSDFLNGIETIPSGIAIRYFDSSQLSDARSWAPEAVVVAGGHDVGADIVAATADGGWLPPRGLFFAPWLLNADLLTRAVEGRGAQVTIGLDFNPYQSSAQRYVAVLSQEFPFETPTAAGLDGYTNAFGAIEAQAGGGAAPIASAPTTLQFFAAAQVAFLPAGLHDDTGGHSWLGTGGLAEVSGTVSDPSS